MTPEQFCYWMQGFVELSGNFPPTLEQWKSIGEHLQQVFNKKTPPMLGPAIASPAREPIKRDQVSPYQIPPNTFPPSDIIC